MEDLIKYIAEYTGHTKISRLIFIAQGNPQLSEQAFALAIDEAKATKNFGMYREIINNTTRAFADKPNKLMEVDASFVQTTEEEYQSETKKKEMEIYQLKSSHLKDAIRLAFFELGQIHYRYGFLSEAMKNFIKAHDYSLSSDDLMKCSLEIARCSLEMRNTAFLIKYAGEAVSRDQGKSKITTNVIKTFDGLSQLLLGKWRQCALKLSEIEIIEAEPFLSFTSPSDVLTFATVCALESYTRRELRDRLLGNPRYKMLMEQNPEVGGLVESYLDCNYKSFFDMLEVVFARLEHDIYAAGSALLLYKNIRKKAFIQYIAPYKIIDLKEMAHGFNMKLEQIEEEVAELIISKDIQARIDSHSKLLYAKRDNEKLKSFQKAITLGDTFIRETESLLLRLKLIKDNKIVVPFKK